MLIDPDHFELTCAALAKQIDTTLRAEFPENEIGYVVVFKDLKPPGYSLSVSNIRADKVEEIFVETLFFTRGAAPKPLASIIPNPFDSLAKNPRDQGEN